MNWETVWSTVIGTVIAALVLATVKYLFKQVKNADYYKKSIIIFIFCFIATIGAALFAVIPAHPTWLFVFLLACALWDAINTIRMYIFVISLLKKADTLLDKVDKYLDNEEAALRNI